MFKKCQNMRSLWIAAGIMGLTATPSWAGYLWGGNGMEQIAGGTVANGAVSMQSIGTWPAYTNGAGGYSTQFTTPACDDVVASRLVLALYGGNATYTANLAVTINGNAVTLNGNNTLIIGGGTASPDTNPEFAGNKTNVYGSTSSGAWVVSVPVAANLNTNGTANSVNVTVNNLSGNFDGRIVYASLWDVYQKASLNNMLQYSVAEGSGDIYSTTPGTAQSSTTASRWVEMGGVNITGQQTAKLDTLYTYVHSGQDNALFMNNGNASNGTLLAHPAVSYDGVQIYDPVQASFNVTPDLSATDNWLKFSVDPADGVTSSGTSVFRPQVAILEVTSVPEPTLWSLLAIGSGMLVRRSRRRR